MTKEVKDVTTAPVGSMIIIQGVPKDADKPGDKKIFDALRKVATVNMTHVEMGVVENVPLYTKEQMKLDMTEGVELPHATLMALRLHTAVLEQGEQQEDAAEQARLAALTPEQREAETAASREKFTKMYKEIAKSQSVLREARLDNAFGIAEKWANKPDLTPHERCHGVAWETFSNGPHKNEFVVDEFGRGRDQPADQGKQYADHYDTAYTDKVKDGLVKSAAALFN